MPHRVNCIYASRCGTACFHGSVKKPLIGDAVCVLVSPPRDARLRGHCALQVKFTSALRVPNENSTT